VGDDVVIESKSKGCDGASGADKGVDLRFEGFRVEELCYSFGYGMVQTACPFTIHVSGLIDSFGTGSNIFDPCPFLYCLYLVFPFLLRQSDLECSFGILCISVSLLWLFSKTFDSYLCRIVGLPL
jgi:hypothetical protein